MYVYLKKYVKRVLLVTFLLLVIGNVLLFINPNNDFDIDYGVSIYFNMVSINRNIIFFVSDLLLLPSIVLMDYFDYFDNRFCNLMVERIGIKKYHINALYKIFIVSFLASLFINFVELICFGSVWSNISFSKQYIFEIFSTNTLVNVSIYILLSAFGTGLYSMFLYSIIPIIKNKYVYRGISVIITFITLIFSTLITPVLSIPLGLIIHNNAIVKTILLSFIPSGLITPGLIYEEYGLINFICCLIIYGILFVVFMKVNEFMRKRNG